MIKGLFVNGLCRVIAERNINIPHVVSVVSRWICLTYNLSKKNFDSQSEVLIRLATTEDLDRLASLEKNKADTGYHIVKQNIKFWYEYGLRCLYVGYLKDDPSPFCWQYFIFSSDIHRLNKIKYSAMYPPLAQDAVHLEGTYVVHELRQKKLFTKFVRSREKLLYQKGIRQLRSQIPCNETKIPVLKFSAKIGYIPDHWISMVKIQLPFFKSDIFVHHPIRVSDYGKFPLSLFDQGNEMM